MLDAKPQPFSECLSPSSKTVTVGRVECQRVSSKLLGGQSPFSYYVPPQCAAQRCPALYLLHGSGSSYQGMLGKKGSKRFGAWIHALTHRPYVNAAKHPAPWTLKTDKWVKAQTLPFVLIAPHNRTLPGGFGPAPWLDGLWSDWNPRYARGGDHQAYRTPPPRFESFIVKELLPFVERRLPVGTSRGHRGMVGHSQGGFGAVRIPLAYPDLFSAAGSQSGGSLPLGRLARVSGMAVGFQPPVETS
jgi:hypothetical protein